jgi:zinc protease
MGRMNARWPLWRRAPPRVLAALLPACLALLVATPAPAQAAPVAPTPVVPLAVTTVEGIAEYRLANGLQVLLVPDDSKPTTTVNVTYRVGSRHENYGETGMAHLLEHLVFKGTPTTRNALAEFARRGFRANGSTWTDRTNYFASFAADEENLRWFLSWQADIMVNSFIAKEDLATEMTVVRNEFEAGENNPGRVLFQRLLSTMYDWHNYGKSTIGARTDIENVDIARLQAFYRSHYQPDNATLIVSGKFDTAQVLAWTQQYFGAIPRPERRLEPTYTLDPAQDGERVVTVRRVGGAPIIYMGYHGPAAANPDFAAVQLLGLVLGDTPGGRLHKRVVETGAAAQAFGATLGWAEPAPLLVGAALAPGQDAAKAREAMVAVLDGLVAEPVTAEELERARTAWLNGWDLGFADPERIGVALSEAIAQGDWRMYFLARDRVRALTLADINRVAGQILKRDNRSVALYEPVSRVDRAPTPERADVAAMVQGYTGDPAAALAEAFDPSPARLDERSQHGRIATSTDRQAGLQYTLLPKGTRGRTVRAKLALHMGTEATLKGQAVNAQLAAALLDKGGAGLTRQQIADTFDRLQAQVSFQGNGETLWVWITTKRERLPEVIALVGRLLREPAFEAGTLEELRSQWLSGIEQQRNEPEALVAQRLERHGSPWPRGDIRHRASFDEEAEDVRAATLAAVQAFHRRFVSAQKAEFAAVGDMDAAAVRQALERAFGNWRQPAAGPEPHRRVPRPLAPAAAARFVEATPDKANANLMARLVLPITDSHPDFVALQLANHIFGRDTDSRLWTRIRETEGLSYDVRSVLDVPVRDAGATLTFTAIFAPANQPRVEKALDEELTRSLNAGFTQAELDRAREGLLRLRRLSRAQDGVLVERIAGHLFHGRRFAREQQIDEAIAALTLAQVNAAWRRHVDPARLVAAWAGDFRAKP